MTATKILHTMKTSIRSIDVGYSLRIQKQAVSIEIGTTCIECDEGDAEGSLREIVQQMIAWGYLVTIQTVITPVGLQMASGGLIHDLPIEDHEQVMRLLDERNTCSDERVDQIDSEILAILNAEHKTKHILPNASYSNL